MVPYSGTTTPARTATRTARPAPSRRPRALHASPRCSYLMGHARKAAETASSSTLRVHVLIAVRTAEFAKYRRTTVPPALIPRSSRRKLSASTPAQTNNSTPLSTPLLVHLSVRHAVMSALLVSSPKRTALPVPHCGSLMMVSVRKSAHRRSTLMRSVSVSPATTRTACYAEVSRPSACSATRTPNSSTCLTTLARLLAPRHSSLS